MERRSSLGGHLSLSTSNIASPLAESTQINGSSLQMKFPWGGKTSPAKSAASNSSGSVIQRTTAPKVVMSPIRKIDPRIYTDVQSNGLASRIVKYHENSSKLNRSMSVGNLYSKPGQFPVVHLKKAGVQVKPKRSPSISVVRIAPPDKSLYQTCARSSILRTGAIIPTIGLGKTTGRESRDNRPIVPPAEHDLNPTRSVLDALKEISRKRINSDHVDCSDTIKKYCHEPDDNIRRNLRLPLTNTTTQQSQQVSVIQKRQRDLPSPTESKSSSPDSSAASKKRPCTKNNDILSSLSSSLLINTPKRKLADVHGRPPIGRISPSSTNLAPPRAKLHCNDRNYVIMGTSLSELADKYPPDQLTPIPPTPSVEPPKNQSPAVSVKPKVTQAASPKPKLTLFNKDYDTAPIIRKENDEPELPEEEGIAGISFIKPKKNSPILTGKNPIIERVQTSKLSLMLSCLSGEFNENDDEVDSKKKSEVDDAPPLNSVTTIDTVALNSPLVALPAPTSTITPLSSITPATTTSSTIPSTTASTPVSTAPGFSFGLKLIEPPKSTAPSTESTASESNKASVPPATAAFNFGNVTNSTANEVAKTTSTTTSSAASFGTELQKPALGTSRPSHGFEFLSSSATLTPPTTVPASIPAIPLPSGGFSFGQPKSTSSEIPSVAAPSTITTTTNAASMLNKSLFSFGTPNPPQQAPATSVVPLLPPATTSSLSFTVPTSSAPVSFGTKAPAFLIAASTQSQTKAPFSFGATTANSAGLAVNTTPSTAASIPSFGSVVSKPLAVFDNSNGNTNTTISFMQPKQSVPVFGSLGSSAFSPAAADTKPAAVKFGGIGNTFGSSVAVSSSSGGAFNFNAPQQQGTGMFGSTAGNNLAISAATTTSSSSFNFAAPPANKGITSPPSFNFGSSTANNVPAFGASANSTASQPSFAFGSANNLNSSQVTTQAPSAPFSFGTSAQPPQTISSGFNYAGATAGSDSQPFSFGGSTTSNTAQPQATKSFSFGGGAAASAFTAVGSAKPPTGGFSFNATPSAATETPNIFGSSDASRSQKTFSFSTTTNNKPDQQQQQPPPIFGSQSSQSTASPAFGAPPMTPGKLFSFGGIPANNNNTATAPTTNLFGTPVANSSSTPLFPSVTNVNASQPFGSSSNAGKSAAGFNFGSSGAATNNSTTNPTSGSAGALFSFGGTAAQTNADKAFSFGSTAPTATAPSGNIFGSAMANKPSAFNFNATVTGGPIGSSNNNNNNNNPLIPNTTNPQGREIRTATRRLKPK